MAATSLRLLLSATLLTTHGAVAYAQWIEVFNSDFSTEIPANMGGPVGLTGVQGWNGLGPAGNQFGDQMLRNAATGNPQPATFLTLSALPQHDFVRIGVLLALIDSWDGLDNANGPDALTVVIDGQPVFSQVFACAGGVSDYTPPPGVLLSSGTNLGFRNELYFDRDQALNLAADPALAAIPHTAATLTLQMFASGPHWQGSNDESWAIDNLRVSVLSCALIGDLNTDHAVDLTDLAMLLAHFGTPSGASLAEGDIDGNGAVDLSDLALLLAHFGSTCP